MFRPVWGDLGRDIFFFVRTGRRPNSFKFIDKDLTNNIDMGIIPSLTAKFIKTPLKALFYLAFSAVPFRFTI